MKKSYITILLLLMVMILGISAVSAADIDDTSDLTLTQDDSTPLEVEDTSDEVQTASDTEVIADSGEGNNFTSLKTLINDASSSLTLNKDYTRVDGDSDIEINKDFTIDGQDTYTIDANNLGGIFKVKNGYTLTLTGVTLINGNSDNGGAVYVENGATLNAENCKFNQNTAVYRGGAIYSQGIVDVKNSIFKNNDITHRTQNLDYGGAGIANIDGTLTVDNCEFSDNVKDYVIRGTDGNAGDLLDGAAILTSGDTTITNSDFFNNSACYGGAFTAIPITSRKTATITIDNCNFTDNLAYNGAAMYIGWNADYDYTISNSWFENNLAMGIGSTGYTAAGGAILSVYNSGSGSITKSTFKDNKVKDSTSTAGGAITIEDTSSVTIEECVFDGNTADYIGGAVEVASGGHGASTVSIDKSNFTNNAAGYGGAVFSDSTTTLTVSNSLFEDNTATSGANSIYNMGDMTLTDNEFAADQDVFSTEIVSGTFTDLQDKINNAESALDLAYDYAFVEGYDAAYVNGVVIANPITINGNGYTISGSNAARIFNITSGTLALTDLTITNGAASEGAAVYINSGAKLDATDVTFSNNVALDNGGAIYSDGGKINLENCVLDANDVTNLETSAAQNMGGAAIYAKDSQVTLVNTNVTNNGRSELDRSNGDLINAVINLINSDATITGGLFENNTGIYGGAIYAEGDGTQTLTVTGATFNNNKAYNGGAIDVDHGMITSISDSAFNNNLVVGPGSSGYYGAGGAIAVGGTGSFNLTDSNFTGNKATGVNATAGAVSIGLDQGCAAVIDDCEFKDNTAVLKAGAVFANSYDLTISNSRFIGGNEAGTGNAIYNGGNLALSGNIISDDSGIYTTSKIDTHVWVIVNDNQDAEVEYYDNIPIVLKITDDNGNIIRINQPTLTINLGSGLSLTKSLTLDDDTGFYTLDAYSVRQSGLLTPSRATLAKYFTYSANANLNSSYITMIKATPTVEVVYENVTDLDDVVINVTIIAKEGAPKISVSDTSSTPFKIVVNNETYKVKISSGVGSVTIPKLALGNYVINASWDGNTNYKGIEPQLYNLLVSPVKGTFTDLANLIANNDDETLVLPYDFAFDDEYDADLVNGIVIDKNIAIDGDGYTINGNDLARIFKVTAGSTLALTNASLINGYAEYGSAIYVDASNLVLDDCTLDSNDVFNLTGSNPNELGGAAIHAVDSTVTITDSYITNNGDRTLDRSNNQVINGAVNLINSNTEITGTLFENNTGIYGGAVFAKGGSLEVSDSKFINNIAYVGAGIRTEGTTLTVTGSKFEENEGRGTGSEGTSKNSGAAICSNGVASISITSSNFTRNSAENGGAINTNVKSSSNTVEIDNCIFTDNVATEKGGAILVNNDAAETIISNSNFTGNDCVLGSAIFNLGTLSLSKNNVDEAGAIANYNVIDSKVIITVLDNENATYNMYDKIEDFYAQVTDDNGNVIITGDKILKIGFGTSTLSLEYDDTDGLYHKANVKVVKSGAPILPSATKKLFTDITFESPYITAIKLNATLEVEYENVTDQDDVVISITLTGKEGETAISTTTSSKFTITVNNVPYSVTITKGKGSLFISDLPAGDYVINASWTGSTYYNPIEQLYNLTVGPKKGTFTDLQYIIDNNEDETLVLPYNFAYDPDYDGNLTKGVVINKAITVDGKGYTIDGKETARILQLNANGITIDNVTFINGHGDGESANFADWGGAIYSNGAYTNHIISNSRFYNNTAYNGGAIYLAGDDSKIINSSFEDNIAFASGGAVFLYGWDCTIEGSNFTGNIAMELGGAVAMFSSHPAIIRESTFTKNIAGQNGGAVSWQKAAGSIFESTFTENEAGANGGAVFWGADAGSVAGGEFTGNSAEGFGGAIFVNEDAGLTIASTFAENSALNGGAIAALGDTTVYSSTFTENAADDFGGAVFVNDGAKLNIKQSTIKDNTATFGKSIYVLNGTVDSTIVRATILDNKTWDAALDDNYVLNATLTDDNGNDIYDPSFRFVVDDVVIDVEPLYNEQTGLYSLSYTVDSAGLNVVSTNYDAENLEILTGILDVPKVEVTEFAVLAIDTLEGKNATVCLTLKANERGLNSPVTVIINNKEYLVNVKDGQGNITIEALPHGQYPVVAILDNPNYENAINSTVFFVKGQAKLNVTERTVAEYGDVIEIAINLTGSDGKPLTGVVVVDGVINVLVENGIGTFVIDTQPDVGNMTFQAVYDGDNDYFGDLAVFNVTVNTKVIDPEDIVVEIPNINEFDEAIPITITSPVDGIYTVNINGTPVEVEVVNGVGNATITLDKPGIYNATVDIADEGYSLETITTDDFEYLVTPEFNVEITGTYPEAEISITGPAGTYHVSIDGMEPVDITREESGLPTTTKISNMDAGNYTAYVSFDARDEYYGDYKEINFTVNKAALYIAEPEVIGDKVVESPINITFTLPTDVDPSSVSAFMDGTPVPEFVINETTGVYTLPLDGFSDAVGHLFTVQVNDPNYEEDGAQVSFTIEKVKTDVTIKVDESEIGVMGSPIVNITVSNNATGYIVIDNDGTVSVVEITNGTYSYQITDLTAGDYYINVTFLENDKYLKSNATVEFNVSKSAATPNVVVITPEIKGGEAAELNITMDNEFATGNVRIYVDGAEVDLVELDEDYANATVVLNDLTSGTHTIGVKYLGNDNFNESDIVNVTVTVVKADSKVTIYPIDNMTFAIPGTISYSIDNETEVEISIVDANNNEMEYEVDDGIITVRNLDVGTYTVTIVNEENGMYKASNATAVFNVVENPDFSLNITNPENSTDTTFTIHVPEDAEGYLLVDVDGKKYYAPVENGTATVSVPGLAPGNYSANITYTGDDSYPAVSATADFTVPSNVPDNALTIPETSETTSPTYSISLPSDATGYLEVDVDGTKYVAPLVNGSASITVPGLSEGNHNVTVSYTGDGKYSSVSKDTTLNVHVPVYAITQNKNINVRYSATANYRVLITKDGKAVGAGETVSITYNGKTYTVRTDSNGYATLKLNTKVKVKKYTITATYKGITVKNTVKVKNIIKAKNKKVKKSRKVTKVRISLLKVNGKVLKNKKIKVKFRYKWYKVKTNKKGVGYFKVKKSMLKKLKVGKKYKYRVTYGKDVVTKKLTIKR